MHGAFIVKLSEEVEFALTHSDQSVHVGDSQSVFTCYCEILISLIIFETFLKLLCFMNSTSPIEPQKKDIKLCFIVTFMINSPCSSSYLCYH